jgi:hypothetical protein
MPTAGRGRRGGDSGDGGVSIEVVDRADGGPRRATDGGVDANGCACSSDCHEIAILGESRARSDSPYDEAIHSMQEADVQRLRPVHSEPALGGGLEVGAWGPHDGGNGMALDSVPGVSALGSGQWTTDSSLNNLETGGRWCQCSVGCQWTRLGRRPRSGWARLHRRNTPWGRPDRQEGPSQSLGPSTEGGHAQSATTSTIAIQPPPPRSPLNKPPAGEGVPSLWGFSPPQHTTLQVRILGGGSSCGGFSTVCGAVRGGSDGLRSWQGRGYFVLTQASVVG